MWWDTGGSENVDVLLDSWTVWIDILGPEAGLELIWKVKTLATRQDLLASHHEIVGVGNLWILWVWVSVEWAGAHRELVEDVEIRVELLADESTKSLLLSSGHILVITDVAELLWALLAEELLSLSEGEADLLAILWKQELLRWVDRADKLDLLGAVLLETSEDVEKNTFEHVHNLVVVFLNLHLQIETSELGHVAWSVGVFGSVNWADTEDALTSTGDLDLLVELRRLCEVGVLAEVWELEDIGSALGGGTDESWRLELLEALGTKVLDEEKLNLVTDILDGTVDRSALADNWVVKKSAQVSHWDGILVLDG